MHAMLTQASRQVAYLVIAHQRRAPSAHELPAGLPYLLSVLSASAASHKLTRSSSSHLAVPRPSGLPYQDGLTSPGAQRFALGDCPPSRLWSQLLDTFVAP